MGSHSSLKSDSLGLDLTGTMPAATGRGLGIGRGENIMLTLTDDEHEVRYQFLLPISLYFTEYCFVHYWH